jgi:beta-glucosidase/6-phospho-beta-glucosidase/beta-galactosidase
VSALPPVRRAGLVRQLEDPHRFDAGAGFVVSTGIECSAPMISGGIRQDELRLTGHWDRVEEDAALVAGYGIRHLRYGIPFHVVAADARHLDWSWTDRALDALRRAGIEPIADLLHFGLPDDLWGFGDPRLLGRYLAFVEAFLARYPWVRRYTPVNEPLITARFSALEGLWNEQRTDEVSFVAALSNTVECAIDAMAAIRSRVNEPVFLQSDACESYVPADLRDPVAVERADDLNARRFVGWDLAYGRAPRPRVRDWLLANGLDEWRLLRFEADGSAEGCIVGLDYYPGNEHVIAADGTMRTLRDGERRGFAAVAREHHDHLGLPFMLAETNAWADVAPAWLAATWNDTLALLDEGLPVRGYCWYSLTDQVDWDSALSVAAGTVNPLGLVDLDRRERPVGRLYGSLSREADAGRLRAMTAAVTSVSSEPGRREDE